MNEDLIECFLESDCPLELCKSIMRAETCSFMPQREGKKKTFLWSALLYFSL